jgi:outer membrane protein OmpA-like peptidoglycan-associated protein
MKTTRDDDYLVCHEYEKHLDHKSSVYPDFITFQHANGNFYFAWVHDKTVILRSEAYPDSEKMERGIKAILKNRDLAERYKVENNHGAHFLCLMGGGDHTAHTGNFEHHNEVGRSCPKKSRRELHDLLLSKGASFADKVVPLSGDDLKTAIVTPVASKIDTPIAAAMAAKTAPADEIKKDTPAVASSKSVVPPSAKPVVTSAASVADTGSGFNWRWLLPLLLIPLFFIWKNCNKKNDAEVPAAIVTTPTPAAVDTTHSMTAAPVDTMKKAPAAPSASIPAAPSCNLHWILYDFNQAAIRADAQAELATMAKILKENPSWLGVIDAHTDAKGSDDYNKKLSLSRAANAKATLVKLGIAANRITTTASSKNDPIATNTDDDSGRQYNRRSELYIKDKSGKEMCKSIAPKVPGNLKAK